MVCEKLKDIKDVWQSVHVSFQSLKILKMMGFRFLNHWHVSEVIWMLREMENRLSSERQWGTVEGKHFIEPAEHFSDLGTLEKLERVSKHL